MEVRQIRSNSPFLLREERHCEELAQSSSAFWPCGAVGIRSQLTVELHEPRCRKRGGSRSFCRCISKALQSFDGSIDGRPGQGLLTFIFRGGGGTRDDPIGSVLVRLMYM